MRENADPEGLLSWYDGAARDLPWRTSPEQSLRGVRPDPYAVWLSEIMLQQTTVVVVRDYFSRFMHLWPNIQALAEAEDSRVMGEWAGLGYYARARNLLKCARLVVDVHGGVFPNTHADLLTLPGIGPYTAAAIAAIAYNHSECVVDGNVERVIARLFAITDPMPAAKSVIRTHAERLTPQIRPGDYAQAIMDLGATICTPKSPKCGKCPWNSPCLARDLRIEASLPVRPPKKPKPTRYGIAYIAKRHDGRWLLERRPDKGLLGGMLGWPGTEWREESAPLSADTPPIAAEWCDPGVEVRHTFTHFHLRLSLRITFVGVDVRPDRGFFSPLEDFRVSDLPSVMRKAFNIACTAID